MAQRRTLDVGDPLSSWVSRDEARAVADAFAGMQSSRELGEWFESHPEAESWLVSLIGVLGYRACLGVLEWVDGAAVVRHVIVKLATGRREDVTAGRAHARVLCPTCGSTVDRQSFYCSEHVAEEAADVARLVRP